MPNLRQTGPPSTPLSTSQYSAVTSLSACNAFNPPWSITYRENLHLFLALTQFFPPCSNKPFTHASCQWKSWHAFCLNMTAKTFSLLSKFKIFACKKKYAKNPNICFQIQMPPLRYQTYLFIYLLISPLKMMCLSKINSLNLSENLTFPLPIIQRNNNTKSPPPASKAAAETVESVLTDIIK